ncbi:MAG TPA: hypothetical protein VNY05_09470 [Candidatus Acidoferrales bacterium]|jgi:hypothetical protein|nr:hypothetical protein [Candidatus Acidoferrales bacterium]
METFAKLLESFLGFFYQMFRPHRPDEDSNPAAQSKPAITKPIAPFNRSSDLLAA